ncbi:Zinc finger, CCCH-type [Fagus crenata]
MVVVLYKLDKTPPDQQLVIDTMLEKHLTPTTSRFNHAFQANDIPQALAAITLEDGQNSDWITDTSASAHITGDPGILENVIPYTGTDKVMVGDGNLLHISHIGNARIKAGSKPIILKNVLLVPNMKKNLISISQLTDDLSCLVEFSSKGFLIKDLKTRKILALGTTQGGLYILNDCHEALFSTRFRTTSEAVWHKRLGHPQPLVVRFLNNKGLITGEITSINDWGASLPSPPSPSIPKDQVPFHSSNVGDLPTQGHSETLHNEHLEPLVADQSVSTTSEPFAALPNDQLPSETSSPLLQHADPLVEESHDISTTSECSPVVETTNLSPSSALVAPPTLPQNMELNTHSMLTRGKSRAGFTSLIASTNVIPSEPKNYPPGTVKATVKVTVAMSVATNKWNIVRPFPCHHLLSECPTLRVLPLDLVERHSTSIGT